MAEDALEAASANHGDRRGSSCKQYLNDHCITSYDIVRKYRLGLHSDRLAIPYLTPAGVRAITLRCIEDHGNGPGRSCGSVPNHPKYLPITDGQEKRLYNVAAFRAAEDVIGITEGEIDAIVMTEVMGIPTVGVPSATAWKRPWRHCFEDFERQILFRDGDSAGEKMAAALKQDLKRTLTVVPCAPGEDPSSMVASGRGHVLLDAAGVSFVNSH